MGQEKDDEESCKAVLSYWLDHPPRYYPATWKGLYELLDDSELGQVAIELKQAVENSIWGIICYLLLWTNVMLLVHTI